MNVLNYLHSILFIGLLSLGSYHPGLTQDLGIRWGTGSQQIFPFGSGSYQYDVEFLQFIWSKHFENHPRWQWLIEPGYFRAHHQLINQWYKLDERDTEYAQRIPEFQKPKTIHEYVLNVGVAWNYPLTSGLSGYILGSIGPMYTDTETERLAKGLAFSDIFGIGLQGNWERLTVDLRLFIRHVSNANLKFPNNGHNSSNVGFSLLYQLTQTGFEK